MKLPVDRLKLYLVTDRDLARGRSVADIVRQAVRGGVTAVQVREKTLATRPFLDEIRAVRGVLDGTGVPLFVNDRADLALAAGADGIHVGQQDLPASDARRLTGPDMHLGVSVATEEDARRAIADGADYISVSPVFLTPTKPDAEAAVGLDGLARIRTSASTAPLIAIGGIGPANVRSVIAAGADGVAVVSAIMAADDPAAAAAALRREIDAALALRSDS